MKSNLVNKVWYLLVFISGAIALWYCSNAVLGAWDYLKLSAKTEAHVRCWEIHEENASSYAILAEYVYEVKEQPYKGKTLFQAPFYLNRPAAEAGIEKLKTFTWEVWYNPQAPKQSSLQRIFPFKTAVYAFLTLGVFLYFFVLRYFTFSRSIWKKDL